MAFLKKTALNIDKYLAITFFLIFFAFLFFPLRHVFFTNSAYTTGAYSDFTSFSLYLSDILLFFTFLSVLATNFNGFWGFLKNKSIIFFIIWLIVDLFWHYKDITSLNWYFSLKYAELIVAYGTIAALFKHLPIKKAFLWFFSIFSVLESFFALWQFMIQTSIGLKLLGEQILGPNIIGVAKIVVDGTKFIRGYGTFPHPNLLSAFLVAGVLIALFLFLDTNNRLGKILLSIMLFVNILGLTITFSRAGYLALAIGLIIYFGYLIFCAYKKKLAQKNLIYAAAIILISIVSAFTILRPYILTRTTITDQATIERETYNKIGLKMVENQPIFGTGIGDSVLHMEQFSTAKLSPWQKQPIHDYFLLAAAELGVPGALILIWIFLWHLWTLFKNLKVKIKNLELIDDHLILLAILCSFLVLMFFDHYFYTLQQTQMLLWVILGIIAAEIYTGSQKRE